MTDPGELGAALEQAKKLAAEHRVPVVVEAILERITNISMSGTNDIGNVMGVRGAGDRAGARPDGDPDAEGPIRA